MCVIFFYVDSQPNESGYKLILASNRDEFYARDTLSLSKWNNSVRADHIYGGKDLEPGREGGTWLALSEHDGIFKIGALLNLTGEPKSRNSLELKNNIHHHTNHQHFNRTLNNNTNIFSNNNTTILPLPDNHFLLGRGMIVSDYVDSVGSTIDDYNETLLSDCTKYNAFNFVSIEIGKEPATAKISICSNAPPSREQYYERKCYGFGNSLPASPFEKVRFGQQQFENIVEEFLNQSNESEYCSETNELREKKLVEHLQNILKCEQKHWPDAELKRRAPKWGESLSALNVKMLDEGYGSRTHTIILIDSKNRMLCFEETMASLDPNAEWQVTQIKNQF